MFQELPHNSVVGVITPHEKVENVNMQVLKYLVNRQGQLGGYITANSPYENIISLLRKHEIDPKRLFFIDVIANEIGNKCTGNNCIFIDSPSNLRELGESLNELFRHGLNEFVFLDSITALSKYNNHDKLVRFIHFFINNVRLHGLKGMVVMLDNTERDLLSSVSHFCDKVIHL
jgi:hypothetical protein